MKATKVQVPTKVKVKCKSHSPVRVHRIIRKGEPKKVYPPGSTAASIYLLPDTVLEFILDNLSYEELIPIRLVCKWFYFVIGKMLNAKFLSLNETINNELKRAKLDANKDKSNYVRVLHIIKSESQVLEAHCLEYIESGVFFFYGGLIFDFIDAIISTESNEEATQLVAGLFVLVKDFLSNFDAVAEPQLLGKSMHDGLSWFGRKLIDCLDCYTNFDFDVNVKQGKNNQCAILGSYVAKNVKSVSPPPVTTDKIVASDEDLSALLAWVRRHVRWNNLLNYIDAIDGKFESFDLISLPEIDNSNIVYSRKVRRLNHSEDSNRINVTIALKCHKALTPLMCRDQLVSLNESSSTEEGIHTLHPPEKSDYMLDFTLEVILNGNDPKHCQIITVQVCQRQGECSIASNIDTYSRTSGNE